MKPHITSVYILEDQIAYRSELQKVIHSINNSKNKSSFKIITIENFITFYKEIENLTIKDNDLFLIDIDLQVSFSGIDFAKLIRKKNNHCFIVFLTNLTDKGIEVVNQKINAASYILKGTSLDENNFKKLFISIESEIGARILSDEEYLTVKKAGETMYIKYKNILYIQSVKGMRNTLIIKTTYSENLVDGSINKMKKKVQSDFFYTELRSFIINLLHVYSLNYLLGLVIFDDGTELEVGEKIIYKLKKRL